MLPNSLCFVDIETTGSSISFNRIMEIGILKIENGQLTTQYNQLINPETHIDPFVQGITGITPEDLEFAPTFPQVKNEIYKILKDSVFVAHNVRFDYGFLRNEFRRFDMDLKLKHFCTIKLSRLLFPKLKKRNLDAIIEHFNIECAKRHRAFDDAKAIWDFYQKAQAQTSEKKFAKAVAVALKRPSIPTNLSSKILDNLPEAPGVYLFYGNDNSLLYIGKSINIHDRVLSHFTNDQSSAIDMKLSQQTKHIETKTTAGELGALLLESTLIKKHLPLYNRQLRKQKKQFVLLKTVDKNGYNSVETHELEEIKIEQIQNIVGIFKSKKQQQNFLYQIAKENQLCHKLLNLEKTKRACFQHQLGECRGACLGKESPLKYNLRFDEAVYSKKIRPWHFPGPIIVKEKDINEEVFVIDNWCLQGSIKHESELTNLSPNNIFDYDIYKILKKFLLTPSHALQISLLRN